MTLEFLPPRVPEITGWADHVRFWLILLGLALLLVATITLAIISGPVPIPATQVWQIAWSQIIGSGPGNWSQAQTNIVWLIRFPRVLMAGCVGAGLAVVGVTMQAVVRN